MIFFGKFNRVVKNKSYFFGEVFRPIFNVRIIFCCVVPERVQGKHTASDRAGFEMIRYARQNIRLRRFFRQNFFFVVKFCGFDRRNFFRRGNLNFFRFDDLNFFRLRFDNFRLRNFFFRFKNFRRFRHVDCFRFVGKKFFRLFDNLFRRFNFHRRGHFSTGVRCCGR